MTAQAATSDIPTTATGAHYLGNGRCTFTLWAPLAETVALHLTQPTDRIVPMEKRKRGFFSTETDDVAPGTHYFYQINGNDRPDPASHYQPQGVHGPSQVVDHQSYAWQDAQWPGITLAEAIIYELHVGTFTEDGTFRAMIPRLDDLAALGVNAVEIMPIAQFPGNRNWGYDGVLPYAVQNSYGTPDDFRTLVDACHQRGIAVILDVVYNHLGPEGNYTREFGPYFVDKYHTPWGAALNYDDQDSDAVREYFAENAVFWLKNYHVDGLRLDAIHAVFDMGAKHFWQYVNEKVQAYNQQSGRRCFTIAESDMNDVRVIEPFEKNGFGFNAQWMDDFHHALHANLTQEKTGYYADFGNVTDLAEAFQQGFVRAGKYSEFRKRTFGNSSAGFSGDHFVVCAQNHDQIGNRMLGERLTALVSFEALKLAAAATLLSPYVPMLFMGEEYAEPAPFQYFVSHTDKDLIEAVRNGRREEFKTFAWQGDAPDPQAEDTFRASQLRWQLRTEGDYLIVWQWYQRLIQLRKETPALRDLSKSGMQTHVASNSVLVVTRPHAAGSCAYALNFSNAPVSFTWNPGNGTWKKLLDSSDAPWNGSGAAIADTISAGSEITLPAYGVVVGMRRED